MLGTPIQNKIEDLQSLMKIIRYQPFCDSNFWKASVGTKDGQKRVQVSKIRYYRLDNLIKMLLLGYSIADFALSYKNYNATWKANH
jgi:SNF2 family DNA or RNA helicase